MRAGLKQRKLITQAGLFTALASALAKSKHLPFDYAVVNEAQDISVAHLRFFAALGADKPNVLFFAGDLGQRIFQQPFSWKSLGVDIRGRWTTCSSRASTRRRSFWMTCWRSVDRFSWANHNMVRLVGVFPGFASEAVSVAVCRGSRSGTSAN